MRLSREVREAAQDYITIALHVLERPVRDLFTRTLADAPLLQNAESSP